jgi:PAS domain S-box-containing protein
MSESDFTTICQEPPQLQTETIQYSNLISEIFSIVREALVNISAGNFCVATLQNNSLDMHISTRRPVSKLHLKSIKEQIIEQLVQHQTEPAPGLQLQVIINGQSEDDYILDKTKSRFNQYIIVPLSIQKRQVGVLYVGSFDKAIDLRQTKLIQHLSKDVPNALRHLWYLDSHQKEKYETLAYRIIDGVILCDWRRKILFINNAAKRFFGINDDNNLIGKSLDNLPAAFLTENLEEAKKEGIYETNKVVNVAKNHSKLIGVHVELLKNSRNKEIGWMIIIRDVTKNWQSDQMRASLSVASHEINAPLTSMSGAIELLLDRDLGEINSDQEHCLQVIKDDMTRLIQLLTALFDLARFDDGVQFLERRKEVRLEFLVNKVFDAFESFAKAKNIQLESRIPKTLPTFKGDRDKLQQVLANLVENSIKFSLPGGGVIVDAELIKTTLKVWVKDRGVGIPSSECNKIFERFYQLENNPDGRKQGYGLGLSIAKQIIESFGGEIWAESDVGNGSTFFFTLPV